MGNWLLQYRYLAQPTSSDTPPTRAQVREVKRKRPSENALTPCARIRVQRAFPDGPRRGFSFVALPLLLESQYYGILR